MFTNHCYIWQLTLIIIQCNIVSRLPRRALFCEHFRNRGWTGVVFYVHHGICQQDILLNLHRVKLTNETHSRRSLVGGGGHAVNETGR